MTGLILYSAHRGRHRAALQFVDAPMLARLVPVESIWRFRGRALLLMLSVALLIAAAARPQFGTVTEQVSARGVDLFVLLDVSRSMLAEDVAPNRLERAKSDVLDLLPKLRGDRVGLIAFAGSPVELVPLTTDQGFFRMALDEVDPNSAPRGGSLIGDAIRRAITALEERRDRDQVIVLITDGEDHESYPLEAAEQAAERGIQIIAIGLGDASEGARIPKRKEDGSLSWTRESDGQEVWSKLDESLLQQISLKTSGAWIPAGTRAYDLGQVYEENLAGLTRGTLESSHRRRFRERYQWFAVPGLLFLLWSVALSVSPVGRTGPKTDLQPIDQSSSTKVSAASPAAGSSAAGLVLAALTLTTATGAIWDSDVVRRVREGVQFFSSGNFDQAATAFGAAKADRPDDEIVQFDQACVLSAQGKSDEAKELYQKAALARSTELSASAHYNLGNLAASQTREILGTDPVNVDPSKRQEVIGGLLAAVGHYRDCLRVDRSHDNARHNLELIRLYIKHIQAEWEKRDREKAREELGLLEFLAMIEQRQTALREGTTMLSQHSTSPQRRQAMKEAADAQRTLQEELDPLKQKFADAVQSSAGQQPSGSDDSSQRVLNLLNELTDEAGSSMLAAAEDLELDAADAAAVSQRESLDRLNEVYMVVAPFQQILQKAISWQERLVTESETGLADATDSDPDGNAIDDAVWNQSRISDWGRLLSLKAEAERPQIEAQMAAAQDQQPSTDDDSASGSATPDPRAQLEALSASMEKAIELAPEVEEHSRAAQELLNDTSPADALPEQQEALRLLKEIAEPLQQDDNQQDNDQQNQDGSDDQDQNENPQENKDQQDEPSDQQQDSDQDPQEQRSQQQQVSQERAESVLRRAREREREHREREKQLRRLLQGIVPVDRDW